MAAGLARLLSEEVDAASLAVFRIGFGFILFVDALRYLFAVCLSCRYGSDHFLFKYHGFEWLEPLPINAIYALYLLLAIAALGICVGLLYRLCTLVFLTGFSYLFLLDEAYYLNHFYMVILFTFLMCVVPANRYWSLDSRWALTRSSNTVPRWSIWLLAAQLEIILIYAGLVKLNWDWLNLEPLTTWLGYRAHFPIIGELFTQQWSIALASYGVIALHLIGAPLLMVAKTRLWVFCLYAAFHCLNHFVFNIGIFPWFTLFASTLLFSPSWPRWWLKRIANNLKDAPATQPGNSLSIGLVLFLVIWVSSQLLIPLRHWVYPGDVAWNEEGHRFSWRMKLRTKRGDLTYYVHTQYGKREVDPRQYVSAKQYRKMACIPDMILQFGQHLALDWQQRTGDQVKVTVNAKCSLNGRPRQVLINPEVDLAAVKRSIGHANWITPLTTPLRDPFLPWHK